MQNTQERTWKGVTIDGLGTKYPEDGFSGGIVYEKTEKSARIDNLGVHIAVDAYGRRRFFYENETQNSLAVFYGFDFYLGKVALTSVDMQPALFTNDRALCDTSTEYYADLRHILKPLFKILNDSFCSNPGAMTTALMKLTSLTLTLAAKQCGILVPDNTLQINSLSVPYVSLTSPAHSYCARKILKGLRSCWRANPHLMTPLLPLLNTILFEPNYETREVTLEEFTKETDYIRNKKIQDKKMLEQRSRQILIHKQKVKKRKAASARKLKAPGLPTDEHIKRNEERRANLQSFNKYLEALKKNERAA